MALLMLTISKGVFLNCWKSSSAPPAILTSIQLVYFHSSVTRYSMRGAWFLEVAQHQLVNTNVNKHRPITYSAEAKQTLHNEVIY